MRDQRTPRDVCGEGNRVAEPLTCSGRENVSLRGRREKGKGKGEFGRVRARGVRKGERKGTPARTPLFSPFFTLRI